jgi:hypothetical protein
MRRISGRSNQNIPGPQHTSQEGIQPMTPMTRYSLLFAWLSLASAAPSRASADEWFNHYADQFQQQIDRQAEEGQRQIERQDDQYERQRQDWRAPGYSDDE